MAYARVMNGFAGTHPSQGVYMFTLENLIRILGDGFYGDVLERVAFNALPATISADWTSHQYVQQVNQVVCSRETRNWTENRDDANIVGLKPNFGCCTANMHQGWPKFVSRLWMGTAEGGLAAVSYAPCDLNTIVARDVKASLQVKTSYPFEENISIKIKLSKQAEFPIKLRIPRWCKAPIIKVNASEQKIHLDSGLAILNRQWCDGDQIELQLPMEVQIESRADSSVGNLPFADWEIYPATPWNYGLYIERGNPNTTFEIEKRPIKHQSFDVNSSPIRLIGKGRRIPQWSMEMNSAGELLLSPIQSSEPDEILTFVPYGSARLRIAEFPVIHNDK